LQVKESIAHTPFIHHSYSQSEGYVFTLPGTYDSR